MQQSMNIFFLKDECLFLLALTFTEPLFNKVLRTTFTLKNTVNSRFKKELSTQKKILWKWYPAYIQQRQVTCMKYKYFLVENLTLRYIFYVMCVYMANLMQFKTTIVKMHAIRNTRRMILYFSEMPLEKVVRITFSTSHQGLLWTLILFSCEFHSI